MESVTDHRAEFIASCWLADGLPANGMLLRPLGDFKRRSHRDVEGVRESEIGHFNGRIIDSNRSGIYDYLPEQLFHLPSSANINTTKKKVDEIRIQREKEQQSRLFFLPLEQEFFQNLVTLTVLEQQASELHANSGLLQELRDFWQAPASLDTATFIRLLPTLPLISSHRGDMHAAAEILSATLRLPVRITEVHGQKYRLQSLVTPGDSLLGAGTLLGGEVDAYLPAIAIDIELPDAAALEAHIHNEDFHSLVSWLLGWFVPVGYDFGISLNVAPGACLLYLPQDDIEVVRLGYASLQAV